jgi:hypothetical protein
MRDVVRMVDDGCDRRRHARRNVSTDMLGALRLASGAKPLILLNTEDHDQPR